MNDRKVQSVTNLAFVLQFDGTTMTFARLAEWLNLGGVRTNNGSFYRGRRGTCRLVSAIWHRLHDQGLDDRAADVAEAFVNDKGEHPWDR